MYFQENIVKLFWVVYQFYKYKEIDYTEFRRFAKYYFDLKDDSLFEGWLEFEKAQNE